MLRSGQTNMGSCVGPTPRRAMRFGLVVLALVGGLSVNACNSGVSGGDAAASGADGNPPEIDAYNATLGRVRVTAVDSAGQPVRRALLRIYSARGKALGGGLALETTESGQAVLSLKPGRYRISVERDGNEASGRATVRTGEDVLLRLVLS